VKRLVPDPDALVTALTRRLDTLETKVDDRLAQVDELRRDVSAVARGMADLSAQLQHLTQANGRAILRTAGNRQDGAVTDGGDGADDETQRDWLAVTDPDTAAEWLADVTTFAADVLGPLGATPSAACWPLHPGVVVELLALRAEHRAAYSGPNPTPVSEVLGRWLPGAAGRISAELLRCSSERAHRSGARAYEIPRLDPVRVAAWWAETRGLQVDAPTAFAMTPVH
jgi:uncharacterized coiled-coil protein SlyX